MLHEDEQDREPSNPVELWSMDERCLHLGRSGHERMLTSSGGALYHMIGSTFGLRLLTKPSVQRATVTLLVVIVALFRALQFATLTTQIQWGYDFSAYWVAARLLLEGISPFTPAQLAGPYSPQQQFLYLYPPPLGAVVTPLAHWFPTVYRAAAWIWAALGAFILVISVLSLSKSEGIGQRNRLLGGPGRWLLVGAALAFPPVIGELVLGNVHLLLLGLLTLAWLGLKRADENGSATGEWIAGIAVGVAVVVKVFPVVLLLWFLVTRRFRGVAGVVVGAGAAALIALPVTGLQPWLEYPTVLANLGPPTNTTDTLAPTVWLAQAIGFTPARLIVGAIGAAILIWAARKLDSRRSFAIAVTISVLVAPAVYHHYLALLVLPLILGLSAEVPLKWLAAAYFLMWGGQQLALGDLAWLVNRGMPTAGAVVLLLGLAIGGVRAIPAPPTTTTAARAPA